MYTTKERLTCLFVCFQTIIEISKFMIIEQNESLSRYDNSNYKTSIAPISSKIIEFSGAPSGRDGKTHNPGTMQSSSTMIRWKGNLGRINESEKVSFQMVTERNYAI